MQIFDLVRNDAMMIKFYGLMESVIMLYIKQGLLLKSSLGDFLYQVFYF